MSLTGIPELPNMSGEENEAIHGSVNEGGDMGERKFVRPSSRLKPYKRKYWEGQTGWLVGDILEPEEVVKDHDGLSPDKIDFDAISKYLKDGPAVGKRTDAAEEASASGVRAARVKRIGSAINRIVRLGRTD